MQIARRDFLRCEDTVLTEVGAGIPSSTASACAEVPPASRRGSSGRLRSSCPDRSTVSTPWMAHTPGLVYRLQPTSPSATAGVHATSHDCRLYGVLSLGTRMGAVAGFVTSGVESATNAPGMWSSSTSTLAERVDVLVIDEVSQSGLTTLKGECRGTN